MKKYNFKSIIAALLCACSLAFQAKAQTTTTPTDISVVGSASITSIDSAGTRKDGSTVTYNASTPTASNSSQQVIFNIAGSINNLASISSGEVISLPITLASGSHFNMPSPPGLSFGSTTISDNGTPIFNVSYSNGTITLTALPAISNFKNAFSFSLAGTGVLSMNTTSTTYMQATTSTFTLDNIPYTIANTPYTMSPANNNSLSITALASQSNSATAYIILSLYNTYNTYLVNNPPAAINPSDALWTTDLVAVATIPANANIVNVVFGVAPVIIATYVIPTSNGGSSMSGNAASIVGSSAANFTTATLAPDLSMSQIESALQPGQRAIVKNSDGSYTIAINYGTLLHGKFGYPSGATVSDQATNAVVQKAIAAAMNAVATNMQFQVNFTDPTLPQSAQVSITDNMPAVFATGSSATLTDKPVPVASSGQTTITVHYVDLSGNNLQAVFVSGGWPSDNTMGQAPHADTTLKPANIAGYTPVTNASTLATATGIPTTGVFTNALGTGDTTLAYPLTAVSNTDVYFVYQQRNPLPITGLQLTAQPQANNDVILTWGTLTEINSKNFTVQRSADGGKTWITVGIQPTQAANGNSSVPLTYQFTDPTVPIGSYEYRVVETDVDGATTTSNVVQISITGGKQVYPNPANTLLNVKLPAGANNVPFRLISADGKIVLKGTITNTGNYGQISVAGIASDIYFLQITVNNAMQTYEVRIQH